MRNQWDCVLSGKMTHTTVFMELLDQVSMSYNQCTGNTGVIGMHSTPLGGNQQYSELETFYGTSAPCFQQMCCKEK